MSEDGVAYTQEDWLFVIGLRRSRIVVTHNGNLEIRFEESTECAAERLREYKDERP